MKTTLTLALAQMNPTVGDLAGNRARMLQLACQAADAGAELVVFPEMALVGYPPEDLVLVPAFRAAAMDAAQSLATATAELPCDLMFGSLWFDGEHTYNASLLASGGRIRVIREKHDLPNYGVFDEKRVFAAGAAAQVVPWRGIQLGVLICEEVWDVEAARSLAEQGAELLLVQNASPYHIGKAGQRKKVVDAAVKATGLPLIYLNLVGGQDELVFDGRSYVVDGTGTDVARLPAFQEALAITKWEKNGDKTRDERVPPPTGGRLGGGLASAHVTDPQHGASHASTPTLPLRGRENKTAKSYRNFPLQTILANARRLRKNMTDAEQLLWRLLRREQLGVKFRKQHAVGQYVADFACLDPQLIVEVDGGQHAEPNEQKKDEVRTAYLNKAGFQVLRFWNHEVLQNPTGTLEVIEEALRTLRSHPNPPPPGEGLWQCISAPMCETRGDEETIYHALVLGLRDYVHKNNFPGVVLGLSGGIDSGVSAAIAVDAIGPERVHTIRLPSPYTSDDSLEDAEQLAAALGLRMDTMPITPLMDAARQTLAPLFAGRHADTTEENIQARLRGLLLMGMSNKFGAMVLTTGNKSEMSVGYATLYGDMCGGFSVLKDVYKTTVFKLARWRSAAPAALLAELGFLGAASTTAQPVIPTRMIEKPPTAELRPNQKDEDSLPPYAQLDTILRGLVERQKSVAELVAEGMDAPTVERVARLLAGAEYKRRQSAPGVKITPMAFGRDRRWPLTNRWKFA